MADRDPGPLASGAAPRRGRPPRLTVESIARAALAVGFAELTVTTVARELGTSHSALYRHVRDRDDLVLVAVDHLVGRTPWAEPTGDWRADLQARGWWVWQLLEDHPGLDRELSVLPRMPSAMVSRFAETVGHLRRCGLADDLAFLATDTVFDLAATPFVPARPEPEEMMRKAEGPSGSSWDVQAAVGEAERIRDAAGRSPRYWFARKLGLVLDGIGVKAAAATRDDDGADGPDGPVRGGGEDGPV
jgi:AcrR family transcriptional regulator